MTKRLEKKPVDEKQRQETNLGVSLRTVNSISSPPRTMAIFSSDVPVSANYSQPPAISEFHDFLLAREERRNREYEKLKRRRDAGC